MSVIALSLDSNAHAKAFQHLADIVYLEHLRQVESRDDCAAIRNPTDESTLLKRAKDIAHFCA